MLDEVQAWSGFFGRPGLKPVLKVAILAGLKARASTEMRRTPPSEVNYGQTFR